MNVKSVFVFKSIDAKKIIIIIIIIIIKKVISLQDSFQK